ncbi:hypothetical protein ACF3MZ_22875 [Paenibacillaceae bacterium WGS1546]|uniref:hypothetical protein n=1 Tax=Cohnella sp. WGS1546 TaxID=3366810 RepID=UPI00372D6422
MDWIEGYEEEMVLVFAEAEEETSAYPVPLREPGLAFLSRFKPRDNGPGTNYICFLLPAWLQKETGSPDRLVRDLAVGNAFAMLHFFLLDDVMDAPDPLKIRQALALGQLFQDSFRGRYGRHFPAESPLWSYYERYLAMWAVSVAREGEAPANPRDPGGLAAKSSPVKLCAAGMLSLAGLPERIPGMEAAIDLALATLQLADDWADWKEDLAEGGERRNAFLALVREALALTPGQPLEEAAVLKAIYRGGALNKLAELAEEHGERIASLRDAPSPLRSFQRTILGGIRRDAKKAADMTSGIGKGDLFSIILTNSEKI